MRTVEIGPLPTDWKGVALSVPVIVGWPELRLTEEQVMANAWARAGNEPEPFPDHSLFEIRIRRGA